MGVRGEGRRRMGWRRVSATMAVVGPAAAQAGLDSSRSPWWGSVLSPGPFSPVAPRGGLH